MDSGLIENELTMSRGDFVYYYMMFKWRDMIFFTVLFVKANHNYFN